MMSRLRQPELGEENSGQFGIVMLAGVDDLLVHAEVRCERGRDGGRLDELRPRAEYGGDLNAATHSTVVGSDHASDAPPAGAAAQPLRGIGTPAPGNRDSCERSAGRFRQTVVAPRSAASVASGWHLQMPQDPLAET